MLNELKEKLEKLVGTSIEIEVSTSSIFCTVEIGEINEIEEEYDEDNILEWLNILGEKEDSSETEFSIAASELEAIEYEDDLVSEDDDSDYFLFKLAMKDGTTLYFHSMYAD